MPPSKKLLVNPQILHKKERNEKTAAPLAPARKMQLPCIFPPNFSTSPLAKMHHGGKKCDFEPNKKC
jgi:hypothetical protein